MLLSETPEEEQTAFVKITLKSKRNLHIFGRFFFPHIILGTNPVPECHIDLLREMTQRKDSAIIFPRNHAKTTWEKIDTIHDIVYALEPVILYVGSTLRDAQFHFESIKSELESNELLRQVYGDLVPAAAERDHKWTNAHFETRNGINLVARGSGKGRGVNIKNKRPTKIILDDIENDEAVRSPDQRQKLHNWITMVIMPSRDKAQGFVKMIGTVLHPEAELVRFYETYGGIKRKAIEDGQSIWPAYWPLQDLERERAKIGTLQFNQEYLNEPITASERLVSEDMVARSRMPDPMGMDHFGNPKRIMDAFGAIDPAISEKQTADYTALATIYRHQDTGKMWLADMVRGHYSFTEQVRLVLRKHGDYKYQNFGIETVAYQKALKQELDRLGNKEGIYVPTYEIKPDTDKVRRFMTVLPFIENGTIGFADTLPKEFFDELLSFPNGEHDDMVDAFVYAATLAMEAGVMPEVIRIV
jgi:predicted phage terminase large subunit-like protein